MKMKYNLYNADCLDILRNMPDESVDCVVTDCPYHIVSGGDTINICGGILSRERKETLTGKLFKHNEIKFSEWLPDVYRVLKRGTHCYIMINSRNLKELQIEAENVGFEFQNLLIWDKGNYTFNNYYMQAFECILMLRKSPAKEINERGTPNILRVPNIMGDKLHPTEKPVELMKILIRNSTRERESSSRSVYGCRFNRGCLQRTRP